VNAHVRRLKQKNTVLITKAGGRSGAAGVWVVLDGGLRHYIHSASTEEGYTKR